MRLLRSAACAALIAAVVACGRDSAEVARAPTPIPDNLAGFYAGDFPCGSCTAIATALWLRDDGVFVLRQRYLGTEAQPVAALGRWRWDETAAALVLEGSGPERRFAHGADATLTFATASPLPHVLARAQDGRADERMRIRGLAQFAERGATLTECVSGLALPLAELGQFTELRRLYRRMVTVGTPARVSVVAHLSQDGATESWVVEEIVEVQPQETC